MKRFLVTAAAVLALAATAASPAPGVEKGERTEGKIVVSGIITTRDPEGTIVVMPPGNAVGTVVIAGPGTRIVRDGREIPLAELKAGETVVVRSLPGEKAVRIDVVPPGKGESRPE